jgi:hypothetical protein
VRPVYVEPYPPVSVGVGMWAMLAGSVLALVGLLLGRKKA